MENLNSVCFINKINKIEPIEGADKIELATINGWTSIVQKGIHKEGDLILCITTDAVIPEDLATKWGVISYLRNKSRVRTVKLRGVYSECVLIPLKDISTQVYINNLREFSEGKDMMAKLNIFKYEPPARNIQLANGKTRKYKGNPVFEVYYKFPNQKNVPNMFNESDDVIITRKMHGTNARYGVVKKTKLSFLDRIKKLFGNKWIDYEYVYGSHNVEKGSDSQGFYSTDVWREVGDRLKIKEKLWSIIKDPDLKDLDKGLIIYGEIIGPGIQGDKYSYNLKQIDFVGFDYQLNGEYGNYDLRNTLFKQLDLAQVPLLYEGKWSKEIQDSFVLNQFIQDTKVPQEGIVVSCPTGNRRKIFKVINPEYHTFSEKHLVPDSH